ncbi:hypothetical protein EYF80_050301 [Liparis tanakae]|uniref:Uncharacterized protein n=1 Tax=Liparis tanakae TaxID=230148 RepID=A0A4Z2FF62_9TELE|nr:hypothetical protein EYF80_050301 [Liparis tanakae]
MVVVFWGEVVFWGAWWCSGERGGVLGAWWCSGSMVVFWEHGGVLGGGLQHLVRPFPAAGLV